MKKYLYILIGLLVVVPNSVLALSASTSILCPNTTMGSGDAVTCSIYVSSSEEIYGFSGIVSANGGLNVTNVSTSNTWQGTNNGNKIDLYTNDGKSGQNLVGTVQVSMGSGNGLISLSNVIVSDSEFNDVQISSSSVSISYYDKSTINTLNSLSVTDCNLTPNFNSNTTSYSCQTESSNVKIDAGKTDSKSSVKGLGTKTLKIGKNSVQITVTSESGASKTYIVNINRTSKDSEKQTNSEPTTPEILEQPPAEENSNTDDQVEEVKSSSLSMLKIDDDIIKLGETRTYLYGVFDDRSELDITAITENSNSNIQITGNKSIIDGINIIRIKVSLDGVEDSEYKILVYKQSGEYVKITAINNFYRTAFFNTVSPIEIPMSTINNFNKFNLVYNVIEESGGLLASYTFTKNSKTESEFTPNIKNISDDYYEIMVPKNTKVLYYLGDKYIGEKVFICSYDELNEKYVLLNKMINETGYVEFTTDGASKLFISNETGLNKKTIKITRNTVLISEVTIILVLIMMILIRLVIIHEKK